MLNDRMNGRKKVRGKIREKKEAEKRKIAVLISVLNSDEIYKRLLFSKIFEKERLGDQLSSVLVLHNYSYKDILRYRCYY